MELESALRRAAEWVVPVVLAGLGFGVVWALTIEAPEQIKRDQRTRQWIEMPAASALIGAGIPTVLSLRAISQRTEFAMTLLALPGAYWIAYGALCVATYGMRRLDPPPGRLRLLIANAIGLAPLLLVVYLISG
ncbi:MAG: hypothetical protein M3T56_00605 [Chloroflexota bacterium]|nr:hypothetical protein [Chloroflexota bacterium]